MFGRRSRETRLKFEQPKTSTKHFARVLVATVLDQRLTDVVLVLILDAIACSQIVHYGHEVISTHLPASRWTAILLVGGLLLALPAAPAFAANSTVGTIAELKAALADCATQPHTITLGANILAPDTGLKIACNTTLNLGTFNLSVLNVIIANSVNFTVTGAAVGTVGTLTVDPGYGSSYTGAGIRTTDATLTVTGGIVTAYAARLGAAIGGDTGLDAGTLNVVGGTVNAIANFGDATWAVPVGGGYLGGSGGIVNVSGGALNAFTDAPDNTAIGGGVAAFDHKSAGADITVNGGVLTATASGYNSIAIGGGSSRSGDGFPGGASGSLLIGPAGEVVIKSSDNAFSGGYNGDTQERGAFGALTVNGILRLESSMLTVDDNPDVLSEITVGTTGKILGGVANAAGSGITGAGHIDNQGVIALNPSAAMVSGNNKLVTFDTGAAAVRIFAPSFAAGARALSVPPARTAWNTAPDGSGMWFTPDSSTAGEGTLPLYAVTLAHVSTIEGLKTALANCATAPNSIDLDADITAPDDSLTVGCDTTLNLRTSDLSVGTITIAAGVEFAVAGPAHGGKGSMTVDAGIRTTNATFTVLGGIVTATGNNYAAAIGGDLNMAGGTLNVAGGTVNANSTTSAVAVGGGYSGGAGGMVNVSGGALNAVSEGALTTAIGGGVGVGGAGGAGASITVTGGNLTATAPQEMSTAIGGGVSISGRGGAGGTLVVGAEGEVVISASPNSFGSGRDLATGTRDGNFGSIRVDGVLRLPSGDLYVGDDPVAKTEIVVGATGRILGEAGNVAVGATITGTGQISNAGAITLAPPAETVSGNNNLVAFSTGLASVRVFAASFTAGSRTLPAPPAGTAWNTLADGLGAWFDSTSSTAGSSGLTLYAVAPALAVSAVASDLIATAGVPFTFPVTAVGPTGSALSPQPALTYTATGCTIVSGNTFETAGSCDIAASATVQGIPVQKSFRITVVAGTLETLSIDPPTTTVAQGESFPVTVTGEDAYGNTVNVEAAVLTSSVATDTIDAHVVTFSDAGSRVVTATLNGISTTVTVSVVAGPIHSLSITPSARTVVQGDTIAFTITGTDAAGYPVDVSAAALVSSGSADTVDGRVVTFSGAGSRAVTATLDGITIAATIRVVAGPLALLTLSSSEKTAVQGGTIVFALAGSDSAGNPVDASDGILTSSVDSDVVTGLSVTFPHASPHTITATLGAVSTAVTINVTPAPAALPSPAAALPATGIDGGVSTLVGIGALAFLLAGGILLITRRRTRRS